MRSCYAMACALIFWGGAALPAYAHQCTKPDAPQLIDKDRSLPEERHFFEARLNTYVTLLNLYLACLERSDAEARREAEQLLDAWARPDAAVEVVID